MDSLEKIIHTLTEQDVREFKYYLNRFNEKRKDETLFNLIRSRQAYSNAELCQKIYGLGKNQNTYYQLRNGLKKQLEVFLHLRTVSPGRACLSTAKYFIERSLYGNAWEYLNKAQKEAEKDKDLHLLTEIMELQASHHFDFLFDQDVRLSLLSVDALLKAYLSNCEQLSKKGNLTFARARIIDVIITNKYRKGEKENLDLLVDRIFKDARINRRSADPRELAELAYILSLTRSSTKNKTALDLFLPAEFMRLEKLKAFDENNHLTKIRLLFNLSTGLLESNRLAEAEKFGLILGKEVWRYPSDKSQTFYLQQQLLLGDIYLCSGRKEKGLETLRSLKDHLGKNPGEEALLLLQINFIALYFVNGALNESIREMKRLKQGDKFLFKRFGIEAALRIYLTDILLHIEANDLDFAHTLMLMTKRKFLAWLSKAAYEREKIFLQLVGKIISNANAIHNEKFRKQAQAFFEKKRYQPGTTEVISYNAWLESRMTESSYYDCLLKGLSSPD